MDHPCEIATVAHVVFAAFRQGTSQDSPRARALGLSQVPRPRKLRAKRTRSFGSATSDRAPQLPVRARSLARWMRQNPREETSTTAYPALPAEASMLLVQQAEIAATSALLSAFAACLKLTGSDQDDAFSFSRWLWGFPLSRRSWPTLGQHVFHEAAPCNYSAPA